MTTSQESNSPAGEHILVVDDDKAFRFATKTVLEDCGYRTTLAPGGPEALRLLRETPFDLLLSDLVMRDMNGIALLQEVKSAAPDLPVIMVTGFGSIATAVEAMQVGASDYLTKPCNNAELLIKIRRALDIRRKDRELLQLRELVTTTYSYANIVSRSAKMSEVIRLIRQVADTDLTVLIQGESGTGKELVARALHFNSKRSKLPFVAVNCSAIPEHLLESELFGHEKGAFTGADGRRIGRFEEAHGGTLFLDEIGDLSANVQTKLLRVLQERTFHRVGGNESISVDTRIVAATNRNLEAMMREGDFREDLFFRLNVFPIALPPLRERAEDIPLLVEHFLLRNSELTSGRVRSVSPAVIQKMLGYRWRGNVRELENLLRRAMIKAAGDTITEIELPESESALPQGTDAAGDEKLSFKEYMSSVLRRAEESYLRRLLDEHKGNINVISRTMDVDRKTVYRKLAEYSIDPESYRK